MKKEGGGGCRPQYCSAPKTALTGKTFFILFSTTNKMLLLDFCTLDRRGGGGGGGGGGESVTVLCCSKNCTPRGNIFFLLSPTKF